MKIRAKRAITPSRILEDKIITIENGVIQSVSSSGLKADFTYPIIAPGYIDSHTHGAIGIDAMSATVEDFEKLSMFYAKHGVTTFLVTTVSDKFEKLSSVAETVRKSMRTKLPGSKIGGLYVEGPYLNPSKKGAHKEELLKNPDLEELSRFVEKFREITKIFAIAPELKNAAVAIKFLRKNGIIPTIAHTDATYEQTVQAIEIGATRATHVFNAMKSFSHREPGVVGAALTEKNVYCEVICDLVHLHPATVKLIINAKGPNKTVLVTDSMAATGLEDGEYSLGELKVVVKGKIARLKGENNLAGSTLTLDQAVRNVVFNLGYTEKEAIIMATLTPARASKLNAGIIKEGKTADLVALDEELNVVATFVSGERVYSA
ncbi:MULTISPECIES: N-acetylglucosamine-6-phosphate deacetylase [Pseudothermotoga]|jgi:N-acetylglucosamine-6-phosphate deacetylase|uniref:N-acetylglucosamine-6-phosphate deacetylase n=1 Tax=Pseudothermotoga lettingae (strain ATCC BAA-301 / DSM 14385 / NBRC 107922 / TMO) TaxID=416591 RepID=A8F8R0_PSELT|nr:MULTISPECIES: N-acetylglucosamine-6-phosphate deacetylase [Pseudothermotoga]ABV34544.1 N-acetylglucosamine-6-phosphate deacetylase [Pseudothermotoga lettingae TMO]KUK20165.1 MAG: N-acetylglucosamine-6-phosphate deacetylase [Pseudothermotoga lettingae]MDI3494556.1 N-acetylglucosamine-6-phosphate deacetylase [Pseudothermotoga sp.]MDK2883511.1 N-acetylglucosamine-6-phosphate deacetylase [Pseudothermotoga sp.]GLI48510.1 N-acetylglucosamine-6-phosphate deacetylase [Pseudothermotoga lettingae TMO